MSFTTDTAEELLSLPTGKTCCKKALTLGLFFGATAGKEKNTIEAFFRSEEICALASELLKKQFSAEAVTEKRVRAGREIYFLETSSKAIRNFLNEIDSDEGELDSIAAFRCISCRNEFLRGVFLSTATVSDPKKAYHLEFLIGGDNRAAKLFDFLASEISSPKTIKRGSKTGLYYKSSGAVGDLLHYAGATKNGFDVTNAYVMKNVRNDENRATNCVASNISRSVDAAQKQIAAIEYLEEKHKLDSLPEEMRYTATLRKENDSASLSELAMLHNPPITKSGLNQRLNKIMRLAEELKQKKS